MHSKVESFLVEEKNAESVLRKRLDSELRGRIATLGGRIHHQPDKLEGEGGGEAEGTTVGMEGETAGDRSLREGVVRDALSVTQTFGKTVDMLAGHLNPI